MLATLIDNPVDHLAEYNIFAVRALTEALRFDSCRLVFGSTLHVKDMATELLVAVIRAVGGTAYLCGGGTAEYRGLKSLWQEIIDLIYQASSVRFIHRQIVGNLFPGFRLLMP